MESDWSVAAGADDPVIETHWSDAASGLAWVDLRVDEEIAAEPDCRTAGGRCIPAMARALALLNAPHGMLMTTKCDRWQMERREADGSCGSSRCVSGCIWIWLVYRRGDGPHHPDDGFPAA